jgi:hypothetical protein
MLKAAKTWEMVGLTVNGADKNQSLGICCCSSIGLSNEQLGKYQG